ncbi:hypothetical protein CRG98_038948 [Punica granatum]|uniref:SIS domain-containing protein n=1 Tax=Punica granatum TaxID=22663 RepID=A0A2I0IA65_PUNGR|nr:hypothetical protein CRG98_038948 [Punica granatum]
MSGPRSIKEPRVRVWLDKRACEYKVPIDALELTLTEKFDIFSRNQENGFVATFSTDFPPADPKTAAEFVDEATLLNLCKAQRGHLNYFFKHLNFSQTVAFTQSLLRFSSLGGTIFFSGVGKSRFVAHKISQTLVSLGTRSSFLSPVDALHGDIDILTSRDPRPLQQVR